MDSAIAWLLDRCRENFRVVKEAPEAFLIMAVMIAALTYFIVGELHSERFAAMDQTEKYLARQLDDYRRAFPGKSPDEAGRELAELRKRVDSLYVPDRHLTEKQREILLYEIKRLKSWQLPMLIVASVDDPEANQYAIEFMRLFKENNIPISENYADPPDNTLLTPMLVKELSRETGVSVSVRYPDNPPESAKLFYVALWKAGIWPIFEKFYGDFPGEFLLTIRYKQ
jgi:hypothetical protein